MDKITSPRIIPRPEHNISRASISENALKVLYRLKEAGYQSCLVGGGVRDMLLGREPKDFDVATNATPEQVKDVFRNCRLIGRRFLIAHVFFHQDIIEVTTFRGHHDVEDGDNLTDEGRILRDNVYGTIEEDAWRRDFTVNALYYNIEDFSIIDYTGGVEDLKAGMLRLIGDPETRFREDPVRMLRAVRFSAKLGLKIDPEIEKKIFELGYLLGDISSSRLFEEVLKMFHAGYALQSFEMLRHYGLFAHLFPQTEKSLACEDETVHFPHMLLVNALKNTDQRVSEGKPVTPAFLIAALLWDPMLQKAKDYYDEDMTEIQRMQEAASDVFRIQRERTSIPRRFALTARDIWTMQPRLPNRAGKRALRLVTHPRFRAAYDFMLLRAEAGEDIRELCDWWTRFQEVNEEERRQMVNKLSPKRGKRKPRPHKENAE